MSAMAIVDRRKATPFAALAVAVILLVAGVGVAIYEDNLYRSQQIEQAAVQAQILAASVTAALVFNDDRAAQEYVNALEANPALEAAAVYGTRGALVASYVRRGALPVPRAVTPGPPHFVDNSVEIAVPVMQGSTVLGTVYLRAISESTQRRMARYGGILLLATMAALVLAVFAGAQQALARANRQLEGRASDLADANRRLYAEMEERAKAEEALRQSQKMEAVGQLSGGIAHDFNNLLTIMRGNLQLLEKRLAQGRTDVQRYLDGANEGFRRAAYLTQRILAFSRRQPLSPQPVNLSSLVGGMMELLRHSVGERVEIDTQLNASWWTLCDANQMENVLINLAINARDAMPNGGRLRVETDDVRADAPLADVEGMSGGEYVRLSVSDTGAGMTEEVRQKAIDPFFTTKPQGQGTGLGLSMTFGYIRQSNGFMKIDSTLGRGTTLTIFMPRYDAPPAATQG
jgi:signal transduction histidine kinase